MKINFSIAFAAAIASIASSAMAAGPFQTFGPFTASDDAGLLAIHNDAVTARWSLAGQRLEPVEFESKLDGASVKLDGEAFELKMSDGHIVPGSALTRTGPPLFADAPVDLNSPKLSDHFAGKTLTVRLQDSARKFEVVWSVIGRNGANYLRESVIVRPIGEPIPLRQIILFDGTLPSPYRSGPSQGPVVVFGNNFFGLEHPISHAKIEGRHVTCSVDRAIDVPVGQSAEASAVLGAARPGLLRRDFQGYVQRERAHPYRPFLHYNTW